MKISLKLLASLATVMLVAAACGSGGSNDQEVIDAVAASIRADGDIPAGVDIECMAGAMVEGLGGAEGLEADFGITLDDIQNGTDVGDEIELSRDAAIALTEEMFACDLQEAMVAEMAADLGEESARCLVGELDENTLRNLMAAEMMNASDADAVASQAQTDLLASMFEAMGTCEISPDALTG